jgi:hypothetical protein
MSTRCEFIQSVPAASAAFAVAGPEANNFTVPTAALATQRGSSTEIWPCHRGYKRCRYYDEVTILRKATFQA